jgi:hypothetical protein
VKKSSLVTDMRFSLLLVLLAALQLGCSAGPPEERLSEAERRLQIIAQMFNRYAARNMGKTPPNEKALRDFMTSLAPDEKEALKLQNLDEFLRSPNDNKPFIIKYGIKPPSTMGMPGKGPSAGGGGAPGKEPNSGPPQQAVFAGESSGARRFIVYATGRVDIVDDEEATKLLK